jgi:dihydrofolate reductase
MTITLIACVNNKNVIGKNNTIPWHSTEKGKTDLEFFKKVTINNVVIMGYNTYVSIGKILPNRINVIITNKDINIEGAYTMNSIFSALDYFSDKNIFIIGGETLYEQTIFMCDKIILSKIDDDSDGDKFFPVIPYEMTKYDMKYKDLLVEIYQWI